MEGKISHISRINVIMKLTFFCVFDGLAIRSGLFGRVADTYDQSVCFLERKLNEFSNCHGGETVVLSFN